MSEIAGKPQSNGGRTLDTIKRVVKNESAVLVIILVVIIIITAFITRGKSVTPINVKNILLQVSTRGIASIGQMFVILTGGVDLSVGGLATLCLVLAGTFTIGGNFPPMAIGAIMLAMLMVGLGIGGLNGLSVSRLAMPALIVTLSVWRITSGVSLHLTGTQAMIPVEAPVLEILSQTTPVVFAAVAVVAYIVLNHTRFGRSVYAVGGSPVSSWLSGIKVKNVILSVYLVSGFLAGLASVVILARNMASSIQGVGSLELDTIAAVCIGGVSLSGGRGSLIGVVIGVFVLGVINNALNLVGVSVYTQEVVKGLIIIGAVAVDTMRRR